MEFTINKVNVVNHNESFVANVTIKDNKIFKIEKLSNVQSDKYLVPGYIDSHTHGGYGWYFNTVAKNDFTNYETYINRLAEEGVTTVIGTTVTCSIDHLKLMTKNWKNYFALDPLKVVRGWYIEGPFISSEKKGAHDPKYMMPIDLAVCDHIKENLPKDFIKIMAVAPEVGDNLEKIKKLVPDYYVAIGHSNASAYVTLDAISNGASRIVHLYNQTSKYEHREPGIVNATIESDKVYAELICDGVHVSNFTLKNTFDIIGPERIIIITDSLMCKGLENRDYMLGTIKIYKTDTIARIKADNNLSGAVMPFDLQAINFATQTKCNMHDFVKMTSYNAAKSLNLDHELGVIKENYLANFLILDQDKHVLETYVQGQLKYSKKGQK